MIGLLFFGQFYQNNTTKNLDHHIRSFFLIIKTKNNVKYLIQELILF